MKSSVIGAGPWGTAVACLLKRNNHEVKLWAFQGILDRDVKPIEGVEVTDNVNDALKGSEYVFIVLNSQFFISTLDNLDAENWKDKKFVLLTKGLVLFEDKYHLSYEILTKKYQVPKENIAVLSGPNIAKEIYNQLPAATVVAGQIADEIKDIMSSNIFNVITSDDVVGVQWSGILKNPVAVGVGLCDGLYPGAANPKSAFIALALKEMQTIGKHFGANKDTFTGVAGIGDLITTCLAGRNQKVGVMLAEGKTLTQIYENFAPQKPEGPEQIKIIYNLTKDQVDTPIFINLYKILHENKEPRTIIENL